MLLEVDFGPFLNHFLTFFAAQKNIVKYSVFVLFAQRNELLQHGKNGMNTLIFATKGKKTS